MPLVNARRTIYTGLRTIWKIEESVEELQQKLPASQDLSEFQTISHEKRQKEWLAVRVLAFQTADLLGYRPNNILKSQWNSPHFENNKLNISFSHTQGYATVLAHPTKKLGIDIESFHPKIINIAPRVFSKYELKWGSTPDRLLQLWCAKEAIFKFNMKGEINFKRDIKIQERYGHLTAVLYQNWQTKKHINNQIKKLHVRTEKYESNTIAYCLEQSP